MDISRGYIYVRQGKGWKDRCTILSQKAANLVVDYLSSNNIQTWIFPGQPPTRPLSIRSAQKIFDKAAKRAEITKHVLIHSLRTTERYTHIASGSVLNIKSPLDN